MTTIYWIVARCATCGWTGSGPAVTHVCRATRNDPDPQETT